MLEANGLYACKTKGDGNCLFNALSDQLYGHQDEHQALRDATIAHMRANSEFYRTYITVGPSRRNPKRKATTLSTRIDTSYHSEEELQRQFDLHVEKMGQTGEWADNMEVSAFASALNVHVRLWQTDYIYTFSPQVYYDPSEAGVQDDRAVLNIAYHSWEHYSSVRNVAGPHSGPPEVTAHPVTTSKKRSSVERDDDEEPVPRASKRRSPLPLFDSDSTPESSSDESNPSSMSSQSHSIETSEPAQPHPKLTLKLRNTKLSTTTEATAKPTSELLPKTTLKLKTGPAIEATTEPRITIDLTNNDATETL